MTVQHLAALLTYATKKPVKMKLTRAESLLVHPKRHPFYMNMTMGCDENGNIMGVKAKVASEDVYKRQVYTDGTDSFSPKKPADHRRTGRV